MTTPAVQLERIEAFEPRPCPACKVVPPDKFIHADGDGLAIPRGTASIDHERVYLYFDRVICPACGEESYWPEVLVLGSPQQDQDFIGDNVWTTDQDVKFRAKLGPTTWYYTHHDGISFDFRPPAAWIGRHAAAPVLSYEDASRLGCWLAGVAATMQPPTI